MMEKLSALCFVEKHNQTIQKFAKIITLKVATSLHRKHKNDMLRFLKTIKQSALLKCWYFLSVCVACGEWYQETPHPTPVVLFIQHPLLDHPSTLKEHSIITHMTDPTLPFHSNGH